MLQSGYGKMLPNIITNGTVKIAFYTMIILLLTLLYLGMNFYPQTA
jgi:hypothetical protein